MFGKYAVFIWVCVALTLLVWLWAFVSAWLEHRAALVVEDGGDDDGDLGN
jgi:heme exporter protein D